MRIINKLILITLVLSISACGTFGQKSKQLHNGFNIPANKKPISKNHKSSDLIYIHVKKNRAKWDLISYGITPEKIDFNASEERLFINMKTKGILPDFVQAPVREGTLDLFECRESKRDLTTYNPCTSKLAKGINFGDGWFGWLKEIDTPEVERVIRDISLEDRYSEIVSAAEQKRAEIALEEKKQREIRRLNYARQDALRAREMKIAEEKAKRKREADAIQEKIRIEKVVKERKVRLEKQKIETKNFREALKVGERSNCGLIVTIKKPIAQVETMVGSKWMRIDELYPKYISGCKFLNGNYVKPNLNF